MNPIFDAIPTSIFEEMSLRARDRDAINLGQGFPDEEGPEDVRRVAAAALLERSNQYPPMMGVPELRTAVADHYRRFQQLDLDPAEVLVTSGATEAIAASLMGLLSPGDEVLLIEPMYDAYRPLVLRAGGVPRYVRLKPPSWEIAAEDLAAAITSRTKVLLLNNPLNPAARVFSRDELLLVASACAAHDLIAICDEVWEHVVFDGRRHIPLIGLPGMRERTVKIGSAGKIFSMTGWKVGFVAAAERLLRPIARAHQFLTFTTPPALQFAVAYGLAKEPDYFAAMAAQYQDMRDHLSMLLAGAGYAVLPSEATYFLAVDLAASGLAGTDLEFCRRIVDDVGVAGIPFSAFYETQPESRIVRFCFAKERGTLDRAAARLAKMLSADQ